MSLSTSQQALSDWLVAIFKDHDIATKGQWLYLGNTILITLADKSSQKNLRNKKLLRRIRERAYQTLAPDLLYELKLQLLFSTTVAAAIPEYQRDRRYEGPTKLQKSETNILVNLDLVQYEGHGGFKIIQEAPSQAFAELVLTALLRQQKVLQQGLAPIDWPLLTNHVRDKAFTREEVKSILAAYRNLIDAWKQKELLKQHLDFHNRGLATFIGLYVDKAPRMNLILTDRFRLNTSTYIKEQLKDPGADNSFLLQLNMLYG
ncbi:MAG: hypothetical protein AAF840_06375 [Bacteroidota bacterium]